MIILIILNIIIMMKIILNINFILQIVIIKPVRTKLNEKKRVRRRNLSFILKKSKEWPSGDITSDVDWFVAIIIIIIEFIFSKM